MTLISDVKDSKDASEKWRPQKRWNNTHRDARRAHRLVSQALRRGELSRGKCEKCGSLRVEAHHPDYAEPLRVVWLCRRDHLALHAELRKAAESGPTTNNPIVSEVAK